MLSSVQSRKAFAVWRKEIGFLMKRSGISVPQIALKCDRDRTYVYRCIKGSKNRRNPRDPSVEMMRSINRALADVLGYPEAAEYLNSIYNFALSDSLSNYDMALFFAMVYKTIVTREDRDEFNSFLTAIRTFGLHKMFPIMRPALTEFRREMLWMIDGKTDTMKHRSRVDVIEELLREIGFPIDDWLAKNRYDTEIDYFRGRYVETLRDVLVECTDDIALRVQSEISIKNSVHKYLERWVDKLNNDLSHTREQRDDLLELFARSNQMLDNAKTCIELALGNPESSNHILVGVCKQISAEIEDTAADLADAKWHLMQQDEPMAIG